MDSIKVFDMVRGDKTVAQVVVLGNGKCVVSWSTSTIVYDSEQAARDVHIQHMGGRGEVTEFVSVQQVVTDAYHRGRMDATQDRCENVPFASVGGLGKRTSMEVPKYIEDADAAQYIAGYVEAVATFYGRDWQTCEFGWKPVAALGDGDLVGL